jgi:peroxiredoxin
MLLITLLVSIIKPKVIMKSINSADDFRTLVNMAPMVIVTSYRGSWCPFCRSYLQKFDAVRKEFPDTSLLLGVSVDTVSECNELKRKLGLGFSLISDETLVMRDLLNVTTGKGHGKEAYLQPSVFIFKNGEKSFGWIQKPTLKNLGGAIDRLSVSNVAKQVAELS